MDEKYVEKYIKEFQEFSLKLEEKEAMVARLSEKNFLGESELFNKANKITSMTYEEYLAQDENKLISESDFKIMQDEYNDILKKLNMKSSGNDVSFDLNKDYEERVDKITEEITNDINRQEKVINNLIKVISAQLVAAQDELEDVYKEMLAASTKADKVRLNIEFNALKKSHDISKQALADMKEYRKLISDVQKSYSASNITYDSFTQFKEKFDDMNTSIASLRDKLDSVDYNDFVVDVTYNATTGKYKVNCKCGNVVLSPAPEFTKEQITSDAIQGILYRFADKVAANSPLSLEEIKEKTIEYRVDGQLKGKDKFGRIGDCLQNALAIQPTGPVQSGPTAPTQPTGPVQSGPTAPTQPTGPVPPVGPTRPVQPAGPVAPGQQTGPVPPVGPTGPQNPGGSADRKHLTDVMKEAIRVKGVRQSRLHKKELAMFLPGVAAAGLGLLAGIPILPYVGGAAAIAGGAVGVYDAIINAKEAIQYKMAKWTLDKIAKDVTKEVLKGDKSSGIKFKVDANSETGEVRFVVTKHGEKVGVIDSRSTGITLGDGYSFDQADTGIIVQAFTEKLNKKFRKQNDPKMREGSIYEAKGIPPVTVDNLEAAFAKFGGYKFKLEPQQFGEMDSSIFDLFKRRKTFNPMLEEDLDRIADRNANALDDGTSIGDDVSQQDIDSVMYPGPVQPVQPVQPAGPVQPNGPVPPVQPVQPVGPVPLFNPEPVEPFEPFGDDQGQPIPIEGDDYQEYSFQEDGTEPGPVGGDQQNVDDMNDQYAVIANQVKQLLKQWGPSSGLDDENLDAYANYMANMPDEQLSEIIQDMASGKITDLDGLWNALQQQDQSRAM